MPSAQVELMHVISLGYNESGIYREFAFLHQYALTLLRKLCILVSSTNGKYKTTLRILKIDDH
jgi:hypothetical protein